MASVGNGRRMLAGILLLAVAALARPAVSGAAVWAPGWYTMNNAGASSAQIFQDANLQVTWVDSYVYPSPVQDPLYWYARVVYRNVGQIPLTLSCGSGAPVDPALMREHIQMPDGSELSVPATATICSRQPSLTATIAPGQEQQQWAIFRNVPLAQRVSLEWKAPGGGPPSGQTPFLQAFAAGPDPRPGPTDWPDEALPPAGTPAMPTGLTATPLGPRAIRVQWTNNAANATSFEVNDGDRSNAVGATATSFDWTGLAPGSSTCFRVRAFNASVASSWFPNTAPFSVCATTPMDTQAPVAPAGLLLKQACGDGRPKVRLTWNPNAEPDFHFYIVEKAVDADWRTVARRAAHSYIDGGVSAAGGRLTPGTVYFYRVRARDTSGNTSDGRPVSLVLGSCRGDQPLRTGAQPTFFCPGGGSCHTPQTLQTVLLPSRTLTRPVAVQRAKTGLARRFRVLYTRGLDKRLTCQTKSTTTYTCPTSWRAGSYRYRGTVKVNENGLIGIRVQRRRG
jgi:hypothetical protein